jgi:hypothetical protein
MRKADLQKALQRLGVGTMKFSVILVDSSPAEAEPPAARDDAELTGRALAHPEVQRFRETFGGHVRAVRNLKE